MGIEIDLLNFKYVNYYYLVLPIDNGSDPIIPIHAYIH